MTWTAPKAPLPDPPLVAGEREMLEGWLDHHRQTLLHKCAGLTAEQLRLRSAEPSTLSLLGLVRHMTDVERAWFRIRFSGEPIEHLYWTADDEDADFDRVDDADAEADFARFRDEVERAREAARGHDLDETYYDTRRGRDISLRWIHVHMIEEYARHNGHADLLRERIDGVVEE